MCICVSIGTRRRSRRAARHARAAATPPRPPPAPTAAAAAASRLTIRPFSPRATHPRFAPRRCGAGAPPARRAASTGFGRLLLAGPRAPLAGPRPPPRSGRRHSTAPTSRRRRRRRRRRPSVRLPRPYRPRPHRPRAPIRVLSLPRRTARPRLRRRTPPRWRSSPTTSRPSWGWRARTARWASTLLTSPSCCSPSPPRPPRLRTPPPPRLRHHHRHLLADPSQV